MKVASNLPRSLAACASASSFAFSTRSTLLRINTFGCRTSSSFFRSASASSSRPFLASISTATTSASCAPVQAVVTMARSSLRRGAKMPGVSMNTSWAGPSIAMPRSSVRVVCTLGVTMATLLPTSALMSVDLPALGAPISAMKPQRVSAPAPAASSAIVAFRLHTLALEQRCGGRLLGRALGAPDPFGRLAVRQRHGDAEFRIVVRARCAPPRDRSGSAGRAPAPIPEGWSWDRATAAPVRASARPRASRPASPRRRSRRRDRPRRPAPRKRRRGSRCGTGPPALDSEEPSRIASPSSIARATSAQASRRTRSASRRDSSPSSAFGNA